MVPANRLRLCQDVVAEDGCAAHARLELRGEDPQECRLPRAVAAEQTEDLALLDREGNVLEGFRATGVRFPQSLDADDLHGPRPTGACYLRLLRGPPRQLPPGGRNAARPERNGPMSHCEPYVPTAHSPDSVPRFVDRPPPEVVMVGGGPAGVRAGRPGGPGGPGPSRRGRAGKF